ncbi:MAG: transketolase [Spirochaetes bacterium]|jgi:transketolase|nr:transketolase [Spirochaetota bacterium]
MIQDNEVKELQKKAFEIRKMTIDAIGHLGVGHIGGAMSIVEVLTLLYYKVLKNIDPKNPQKEGRDRVVLSKGHAGPSLYSILADKGYFPTEWLYTLNHGDTHLPSHCDMNRTPGIDMTTGSLGTGASAAIGMTLADTLKGFTDAYTYLIIGDGESQEGQIWEAAMFASMKKLGNLIAFTDYNKQQIDGYTQDIMSIDDLNSKWTGFGWHVQRVDGHDFRLLDRAIKNAQEIKERPSMIILDTIKSKGFCYGEGIVGNHNMSFDKAKAEEAIKILTQCQGE